MFVTGLSGGRHLLSLTLQYGPVTFFLRGLGGAFRDKLDEGLSVGSWEEGLDLFCIAGGSRRIEDLDCGFLSRKDARSVT